MKVGFFGFGNMGRAIAAALKNSNPALELFIYTPNNGFNLENMPDDLDYYFLAFKPQNLEEFKFNFRSDNKLISILAGVSLEKLSAKFEINKIVRFMPNTPVIFQEGAGLLFYSPFFTTDEKKLTKSILEATGKVFVMNSEDQLDRTTGFSGSGPGIIFEIAKIFEDELNQLTYGELDAREIIAQTFLGTAIQMKNDQSSFIELRDKVTSKKGVTFEALNILEQNNIQNIFKEAFKAAYKRTQDFK